MKLLVQAAGCAAFAMVSLLCAAQAQTTGDGVREDGLEANSPTAHDPPIDAYEPDISSEMQRERMSSRAEREAREKAMREYQNEIAGPATYKPPHTPGLGGRPFPAPPTPPVSPDGP